MSEWMTVTEAAAYARCHRETVAVALRDGELVGAHRKKGAHWKVQATAVDSWLSGGVG
jgi:excisionase family DNA binding protein